MVYVKINGNRRVKWSEVIAKELIGEFGLSDEKIIESPDYDIVIGPIDKKLAEEIRDSFHIRKAPGYCARIDDYL